MLTTNISKTVGFCARCLQLRTCLLVLLSYSVGFAVVQAGQLANEIEANPGQEIGTPYIKPDGWKIKSAHVVLSPDGKRLYTIFKKRFYVFQIKPFKLLQEHETPLDVKKHLAVDLFLTRDEKHLVLTLPDKIVLYDFVGKKIVRSIELEDHELQDSVLNGNELVVFTKDSNLEAYRKKEPDAERDDFINRQGNLLIYDVYSLKLKREAQFQLKNESPNGVWLTRMHIVGDYISLIRRQYQQYSWVFLDRVAYKTRLVFLLSASEKFKISTDMQHIYLPDLYDTIYFNAYPSYSVGADGKFNYFPARKNAWFNLKDKQFVDAEKNADVVKELNQSPFTFTPLALQVSQACDYVVYSGSRIFDLKTKQVFSLYLFENKQAVLIERATGHFAMTDQARKYLTMKTKNGNIVPINDATFNRFNLKK